MINLALKIKPMYAPPVSCSTHQVFVAEGEPAVFECRVEPKHDLNLAVRWYRNDEELVGAGSSSWHIPQKIPSKVVIMISFHPSL